jgi:hypothetical protein
MKNTEPLYKVLGTDGNACHGGSGKWHLPKLQPDGTYKPGQWMPRLTNIELCSRGYHLCRRGDLLHWLNATIYEAEADGRIIIGDDKVVVSRARLLRPLGWNEKTARLFAADCAEDCLPFWERYYPDDDRPRKAIAAARAYARGEITLSALSAAESAAWSAVDNAAWSAAKSAAWNAALSAVDNAAGSAARSAARSAAKSAAESAAESAAWSAAWNAVDNAAWSAAKSAAKSAAWNAAGSAAWNAAWNAAWSAAWSAAKSAQTERLFEYLEGRI